MGTIKETLSMTLLLISLISPMVFYSGIFTGYFLPIIKLNDEDYIPGVVIVNVSEDTWTASTSYVYIDCTCGNGYQRCMHNCSAWNGMCMGSIGDEQLHVHSHGGTGSGQCGSVNEQKEMILWFNMSEGRTAQGNFFQVPWYLIKNVTVKIYADTGSITTSSGVCEYTIKYEDKEDGNPKNIIEGMVKNKLWYDEGDDWRSNTSWRGDNIECQTISGTPLTVEWDVTDYTINQTNHSYDVMLGYQNSGSNSVGVTFYAREHSLDAAGSHRAYMEIYLNPAVCGDGYCTPVNETIDTCYQDCGPTATVLSLYLNGTSSNTYYVSNTYANFTIIMTIPTVNETDPVIGVEVNLTTNMTGWADQSGSSSFTNVTQITCSQNNTWYNITGYYEGNDTYAADSETFYAICYLESTTLDLYLNGTDGDKEYEDGTYANFTAVLNEDGIVNLTTNMTGWTDRGGNSPLENISLVSCSQDTVYNITGWFSGNSTHLTSSETHYVNCTAPVTTTTPTTTTPSDGGGGGGGGGGGIPTTTTTTSPVTTVQVTNITTTTLVMTTTFNITTTTTPILLPLKIGKIPSWGIYVVGALVGIALGAAILMTIMILHRKKFGMEVT